MPGVVFHIPHNDIDRFSLVSSFDIWVEEGIGEGKSQIFFDHVTVFEMVNSLQQYTDEIYYFC